jgi:hypothetical protein
MRRPMNDEDDRPGEVHPLMEILPRMEPHLGVTSITASTAPCNNCKQPVDSCVSNPSAF